MNTLTETELHFQKFWKPKVGHKVIYKDKMGNITNIDKKYPEQIQIKGYDEIFYLQDCLWKPNITDIDDILKDMGINVLQDSYYYNKMWKPKGNSLEYYLNLISEFRIYSLTTAKIDPVANYLHLTLE